MNNRIEILKRKSREMILGPWLPVLIVLAVTTVDLAFRLPYFRLTLTDCIIYSLSILYDIAILTLFFRIGRRSVIASYLLVLVYIFALLTSYTFYIYFKAMPGINTFSYLFLEPGDFFGIAADGSNPWYWLIAIALLAASWYPFKRWMQARQAQPRWMTFTALVLVVTLSPVFYLRLAVKDNRTLPFSNGLFCIIGGWNDYKLGSLASYRLMHRTPTIETPEIQTAPDVNLLVFVNESLSAEYFKEFGSGMETTPRISSFIDNHSGNVFVFPYAYSNATVTKVSVSCLLAGLNPVQGKHLLGKSPLFYEILKNNLSGYRTGLMTSWSYAPANFIDFVDSPALDYLRCIENTGAPKVCNVSADDSLITGYFSEFLGTVKRGEKFCAVLHYGNTHYPYFSKTREREYTFHNRVLDDYLAAVGNLDMNISAVLDTLDAQGLLDNTMIVFTSDHGEAFGEVDKRSGHLGLFTVYTTRVPFWLYVPEQVLNDRPELRMQLAANERKNICNTDIYPTILDLYGINSSSDVRLGTSLFGDVPAGRDLFVFNGLKENRTDNREYVGVIRDNEYYVVEDNTTFSSYYRFDLDRTGMRGINRWGVSPLADSTFIASLTSEHLEMFLKPPLHSESLAVMSREWLVHMRKMIDREQGLNFFGTN
jgi:glucan phosphoethanolaminetransferase (alkaline phosphatase superfamily)